MQQTSGPLTSQKRQRFPWRGAALGGVMSLAVVSTSIYYNTRVAQQGLSNDFLATCAMFFLLIITIAINPLLRLISPRLGFSGPDLLVALSMMLIASAIPSWGLMQMWVSTITAWKYFATPENSWLELIGPYLRPATVVHDDLAIRYLYEGLPPGESIPWSAWVRPIAFWFPFFVALYMGTICFMVLLRKQWVEHERLAFPMMQFGTEVCKQSSEKGIFPAFLHNRAMWLGAVIPTFILSYNGVAYFVPFMEPFSLAMYISALRRTVWYSIRLNFPALGFAYFVGTDVSLSMWLFHVLSKLHTGILRVAGGPTLSDCYAPYCSSPTSAYEALGSMIVLFLFGLWVARKRLAKILWTGLRFQKTDEDAHEIASYRGAVWGMLFCFAVLFTYLHHLHWSATYTLLYLLIMMVVFYSLTRVMCEGGVGFGRAMYTPPAFMSNEIGPQRLGPAGTTTIGFTLLWSAELRTLVMTQATQGMRLTEEIWWRRPLIWCFLAAILIALFGSLFTALTIGYKYGLYNCYRSWPVWPSATYHWSQVARFMKRTEALTQTRFVFTGAGAAVMASLIFLRYRFVWWPVHYVGLPICESWPMQHVWFSIFLAWLIKIFVLKYGSTEFYNKTKMFFIGIIFGALVTGSLWTVMGLIFHQEGRFLWGVTLE